MADIRLKHVSIKFRNGVEPLKDVDIEVKDKEFVVIAGEDGCGKSTLLKVIAGLEDGTSGDVFIDGQCVNDVDARDRNISMLLENSILYPDMTVYDNLTFSLKMRRFTKQQMEEAVKKISDLMGLENILELKPESLSRLQVHKVVMARALVRGDGILLMDEPMEATEGEDYEQLLGMLKNVWKKLGLTMILVTSEPETAKQLGLRTIVMQDGCIVQNDTVAAMLEKPSCVSVVRFLYGDDLKLFTASCKLVKGVPVLTYDEGTLNPAPESYARLANYNKKEVLVGVAGDKMYIFDASNEHLIG